MSNRQAVPIKGFAFLVASVLEMLVVRSAPRSLSLAPCSIASRAQVWPDRGIAIVFATAALLSAGESAALPVVCPRR